MAEQKLLDIAHIIFLDMIEGYIKNLGASTAKGSLMRSAINTAEAFPLAEFASMDEFVKTIEDFKNPIAQIEGKAVHMGDGLFGLPQCPFAESIGNYTNIFKNLPASFSKVPEDFNKPGPVTEKYKVGHGAGVSPFCAIHQPLRSALGMKIRIGGKQILVWQLGCKSGSGKKAIADKLVEEAGFKRDQVETILDNNMCCYAVIPQ